MVIQTFKAAWQKFREEATALLGAYTGKTTLEEARKLHEYLIAVHGELANCIEAVDARQNTMAEGLAEIGRRADQALRKSSECEGGIREATASISDLRTRVEAMESRIARGQRAARLATVGSAIAVVAVVATALWMILGRS